MPLPCHFSTHRPATTCPTTPKPAPVNSKPLLSPCPPASLGASESLVPPTGIPHFARQIPCLPHISSCHGLIVNHPACRSPGIPRPLVHSQLVATERPIFWGWESSDTAQHRLTTFPPAKRESEKNFSTLFHAKISEKHGLNYPSDRCLVMQKATKLGIYCAACRRLRDTL
jgi:hypothetical protein